MLPYLFFPGLHELKYYNLQRLPNKKRFSSYYCFDDNDDSHEGKTERPFFCLVSFYIQVPEYFCPAFNFVELFFLPPRTGGLKTVLLNWCLTYLA